MLLIVIFPIYAALIFKFPSLFGEFTNSFKDNAIDRNMYVFVLG